MSQNFDSSQCIRRISRFEIARSVLQGRDAVAEVTRTLLSSQTDDCATTDEDDEDIIDYLFWLITQDHAPQPAIV